MSRHESIAWAGLDRIHEMIVYIFNYLSPSKCLLPSDRLVPAVLRRSPCPDLGQTTFFFDDMASKCSSRFITLLYMSEPITSAVVKKRQYDTMGAGF